MPSQLKKPFVGEGCRGSHEQGNRRDLIQVIRKTCRLTINLIVTIPGDVLAVGCRPVDVPDGGGLGAGLNGQVESLTSFKVSRQLLMNDLNQVSSVSLLMTSSTALANEGLFELTRRPSLTRAVSLSLAETTEAPGCSQVKKLKFGLFT